MAQIINGKISRWNILPSTNNMESLQHIQESKHFQPYYQVGGKRKMEMIYLIKNEIFPRLYFERLATTYIVRKLEYNLIFSSSASYTNQFIPSKVHLVMSWAGGAYRRPDSVSFTPAFCWGVHWMQRRGRVLGFQYFIDFFVTSETLLQSTSPTPTQLSYQHRENSWYRTV